MLSDIELKDIKGKALSGFLWEFSGKFVEYLLNFIFGIILVRILEPFDYGIIGLTYIFIRIAVVITDSGFSKSIIQNQDASDNDYSTVLISNIIFASFLYLILFLIAPFVAIFFNEDKLTDVIRIMGFSIVIHSFNIIQLSLISKNLNFRKSTIINLVNIVVAALIAIILAKLHLGYWSLVAMNVLPGITGGIMLWVTSEYKLKFNFSKQSFNKLIKFGYTVTIIEIISIFFIEIYNLIIGKKFSTTQVGYFSRANQTNAMVSGVFSVTMQKILFPIFSKLQNNPIVLSETILKGIRFVAYINFSLVIYLLYNSNEIFIILFTEKWIQSVWMFQIICLQTFFLPINSIINQVLLSKGLTGQFIKYELLKRFFQLLIILIFLKSIFTILIGIVLVEIIDFMINLQILKKFAGIKIYETIKILLPFLIMIVPLLLLNFLINSITGSLSIYLKVSLSLIANAILVLIYGRIFKLTVYSELIEGMKFLTTSIKVIIRKN